MPGSFYLMDSGFPEFTGQESVSERLNRLTNYLYMLLEELRWMLRNLGPENFNEAGLSELESAVADRVEAGTVVTRELYADYGDIADLTVWRLRTDYRRAQNRLAGDTADLNYLDLHDEQISLITAATDGSESEQLSRDGRLYWWTDAAHSRMTAEENTGLPVLVYRYTERTKASLRFSPVGGTVMPVLTLGAGDENGRNVAKLYKSTDGMHLDYVNTDGTTASITHAEAEAFWRVNGLAIQVVTDYPAAEEAGVLYIKTGS